MAAKKEAKPAAELKVEDFDNPFEYVAEKQRRSNNTANVTYSVVETEDPNAVNLIQEHRGEAS